MNLNDFWRRVVQYKVLLNISLFQIFSKRCFCKRVVSFSQMPLAWKGYLLLIILQNCCLTKILQGIIKLAPAREIHPLDPQPHRHSMLVPRVCAPRVTRCRLGKYWWRDFFRKRLRVVDSELAIQSLISFCCLYLGQIGCQGDGLSRQPIVGVHMLSMTHREAAIFDDAYTVPTPCLLLPAPAHMWPTRVEEDLINSFMPQFPH